MYFFIVVRQGRLFVRLDEWGRRNIVLVGGGARVQGRRRLRLLEVAGGRLGSVLLANELGVDKHLLEGLGGLRADQVRRRTHARLILVGVALGLRGAAAVDRERGLRLLLVLGR